MSDNSFVESAKKMTDPVEILNWYRNLYYKEPDATETGIVARALNDILPELVALKKASSGFVKTSERLPMLEFFDFVEQFPDDLPEFIVIIEGAVVPTALYFDGNDFFGYDEGPNPVYYKCSHWMNMPPMPKGE